MSTAPFGLPGISSLIPHRETMLLVDRVVELVPGESVLAHKAVSYGEPWYRGMSEATEQDLAYPLPLLLESWNQAAAVLVMTTWQVTDTDVLNAGVPMLGSYTNLTIGSPVLPGDIMEHRVKVVRVANTTMVLEGSTRTAGGVALRIDSGVVVRKPAATMAARRSSTTEFSKAAASGAP